MLSQTRDFSLLWLKCCVLQIYIHYWHVSRQLLGLYFFCLLWLQIHDLIQFLLCNLINPLGIVLLFTCRSLWWYSRRCTHSLFALSFIRLPHYIRRQNAAMCCIDEGYGHLFDAHRVVGMPVRHHKLWVLFCLEEMAYRLVLKQMKLARWILN